MTRPWYETFFDGDYQLVWRRHFSEVDTAREVDLIWRLLGLGPGMRVLDTVCGFGRHAIPLAERGCAVTGCDLSETELSRARSATSVSGTTVRWLKCDMRELPFDGEFDAAFNVYSAFGYFEDDAENQRALQAFRRSLRLGGGFVFDFANVLSLSKRFRKRDWDLGEDGIVVLREARPDFRHGITWEVVRFIEPGKSPRESTFGVRMYTVDVLVAMFERAGFRVDRILGDWDEAEVSFESPRVIFTCTAV
ncbi:MAG: methyltransferase domain-containing protein [Deltaproteobacteria bacterium]|nr:methyltransferase domain-containing protein [Deltaproteobacteria bacterium]